MPELDSKTTIWRNEPSGQVLVRTFPGFPFGVPQRLGETVHVPNLGNARCVGIEKTGAGPGEVVREVRFAID